MTFTTINNDADNGMQVNTVVELLIPKNDEPFPAKPWRVTTRVNYSPMFHAHFVVRGLAEQTADRMHKAYLDVHRKK